MTEAVTAAVWAKVEPATAAIDNSSLAKEKENSAMTTTAKKTIKIKTMMLGMTKMMMTSM